MKMILVVEDEYGNAEILQLLLEAEGYRVATASNGKQALELLENGERPALILSDFMMPVMNGGELGQIVSADESLRQITFIFMSGTLKEVVRRAFDGYDEFIVKPFELDSLLPVIKRLIESGRTKPAPHEGVEESLRHLLKGIQIPTQE